MSLPCVTVYIYKERTNKMVKVEFEYYNEVEVYETLAEAEARVAYFDEIEGQGFCWVVQ
jgi:hypothetical protein